MTFDQQQVFCHQCFIVSTTLVKEKAEDQTGQEGVIQVHEAEDGRHFCATIQASLATAKEGQQMTSPTTANFLQQNGVACSIAKDVCTSQPVDGVNHGTNTVCGMMSQQATELLEASMVCGTGAMRVCQNNPILEPPKPQQTQGLQGANISNAQHPQVHSTEVEGRCRFIVKGSSGGL